MDYNKVLEWKDFSSPEKLSEWMEAAVEAIKELKARAEAAEAIVDKYQTEIVPRLRERAETAKKENAQLKEDLENWSYNCNAAIKRAQQFKRERDAAHALIKQDMHQEETGELVTCFGYPLEKVRDLVEADKVGRCFILTDERIRKANEMFKSWLFGGKEE